MICTKLQSCIDAELSGSVLQNCDNMRASCIESSDCRSMVKCEENNKKYILENTKRNHVISYKMDGGIVVEDKTVPTNTNKCDYLFVVNDNKPFAIVTELKGVEVPKALAQLRGTLEMYRSVFDGFSNVYARAIVTSSTPNLKATPAYVNLEKLVRQRYKGNVKIVERQLSEKDTKLG